MASLISAVLIIFTLLFLTEYFYHLPQAVLAAVIMVAVFGLIDFKEARHLWDTDRLDFSLFMTTALGTLMLGIEEGILVGVVLSLGMVIYRSSFPHIAELGRIPNSTEYRNLDRFDNLEIDPSIFIIRIDAQLYFANLDYVKDYIHNKISKNDKIRHLIIDASAINAFDSSAVHMIHELEEEMRQKNIHIHFVQVKGPVRDVFKMNDLLRDDGPFHFALTIENAVTNILSDEDADINSKYYFESKIES
jgi:SulP family sulfate permease